jgi:hypothetical protein
VSVLGGGVTYCTVVEFEWGEGLDRERFAGMMASVGAGQSIPEGRLSHIAGIDDTGARVIEVWRSGDDARRFAEQSRPSLAAAAMPAPARVFGFEVSSYVVS